MASSNPFISRAPQLTQGDPAALAYEIQRQQQLANLLTQEGNAPVQSLSNNPGAQISWTQGLAKMLQAYQGGKAAYKTKQLLAQQDQAQQDKQGSLVDALTGTKQVEGIDSANPGFTTVGKATTPGDQPYFDRAKLVAALQGVSPQEANPGLANLLMARAAPPSGFTGTLPEGAKAIINNQVVASNPKYEKPVNLERKTRVLDNNMAQDYNFDPATGKETLVGSPYKHKDPPVSIMAGAAAANAMTGDALTNAAERYRQTGVMPALGMGGASLRVKILNKAAEMSALEGDDAKSASLKQQANKASQAGLAQITKQQTVTGAFEKTAIKNLDLALQTSAEFARSGSPLYNKAVVAFSKGVSGDPATARFVNALTAARNEYAKVLSSSTGAQGITDSARKEAEDLFSKVDSHEMLVATINLAKQEMQNRMSGFTDQIKELSPSLSGTTEQPVSQVPPVSNDLAAQAAAEIARRKTARGG